MIIGQLRKGDAFVGKRSKIPGLCIAHLPKNGEGVWAIKIIVEDDLHIIYDSHDSWNLEVKVVSKNNDVSQYNHL